MQLFVGLIDHKCDGRGTSIFRHKTKIGNRVEINLFLMTDILSSFYVYPHLVDGNQTIEIGTVDDEDSCSQDDHHDEHSGQTKMSPRDLAVQVETHLPRPNSEGMSNDSKDAIRKR
jgi:hypothetical protein